MSRAEPSRHFIMGGVASPPVSSASGGQQASSRCDDVDQINARWTQPETMEGPSLVDAPEDGGKPLPVRPPLPDDGVLRSLAAENFEGPTYEAFVEELVKFGLRVCRAWIANGRMHRESAASGRPIGPPPLFMTTIDHSDLAVDTVMEGSRLFRRVALVGRQWSPAHGASLRTYFLGACVQVYPTVYRQWYRQAAVWMPIELTDETVESRPETVVPSVDTQLWLSDALNSLRESDTRGHAVLRLVASGYTHAEIASVMGCTAKAVERILSRVRRKLAASLRESED